MTDEKKNIDSEATDAADAEEILEPAGGLTPETVEAAAPHTEEQDPIEATALDAEKEVEHVDDEVVIGTVGDVIAMEDEEPESEISTGPRPPTGERRVIVRAVGVKKHYEMKGVVTKALRNIDMEIYAGEFICVMGPSGSGKSTFFNMVGGLDSPTAGRVFIDEVDVAQLSAVELAFLRCRKIGYIFQSYNLIQYQTALENVTTPMAFAGVSVDEARNRGMDLLELVGLKERWFHRPIEMSGGQQQRVAIARSLANNPMILLADEPTANLDLNTGQEVLEILQRISQDKGVTVICATHDYRMMDICDRLMWIRDGEIERIAERKEVDIELSHIEGE